MRHAILFLSLFVSMTALAHRRDTLRLSADNIPDVVRAMTIREKTLMVTGGGWNSMFSGFGIPLTGHPRVPGASGTTHAISRLGIPASIMADGPAGVRIRPTHGRRKPTSYATCFPCGTSLSSSWDDRLVRRVGHAIGQEAALYGIDVMLTPGVNILRNPLCGRGYEYYSEDPFLCGRIAGRLIEGIQAADVGACIKHFAANNQETNRRRNDSRVDSATLRDIYLRPFEIAIKEARPWTVMSSYNLLNGVRTQENRWLLTNVLRERWGFDGLVMTDWTGTRSTRRQLAAGNDLMMPGNFRQRRQIRRALRKGRLSMAQLDTCVSRILGYVVRTRSFRERDNAQRHAFSVSRRDSLLSLDDTLSRQAAAAGMVLLRNENGTLPISSASDANGCRHVGLFGATSYEMIASGCGSGHVNSASVVNMDEALTEEGYAIPHDLADSYRRYIHKRKSRNRATGMGLMSRYLGKGGLHEKAMSRAEIERVADSTDVAILTIGRQTSEGKDRKLDGDFMLTPVEKNLIRDVCEVYHERHKRVVVLLNVNGVIETASWNGHPDAILLCWLPGQTAGRAVMDVLSGRVNPSGRLPMTWPISYDDVPSAKHFPLRSRGRENVDYTLYAEGREVGYRYYNAHNKPVAYPFAFGLSYTTFTESTPVASADGMSYSVTVTNTGGRAGSHVVALYKDGELEAYGKSDVLEPGGKQTLRITPFCEPR